MRILIGSTPKLGAGTNIQERMIAIHHVDVPWRASDIEQQNGRAFRQGNMYNEIYEFRYVTKNHLMHIHGRWSKQNQAM